MDCLAAFLWIPNSERKTKSQNYLFDFIRSDKKGLPFGDPLGTEFRKKNQFRELFLLFYLLIEINFIRYKIAKTRCHASGFSFLVNPAGFKPATSRAVIWCTIQLCYGSFYNSSTKVNELFYYIEFRKLLHFVLQET